MDKYNLLIILNIPFVIYGISKALILYKERSLPWYSLIIRLVFWLIIGISVVFAQGIYTFLIRNDLTNSAPLSIADVVLVTGVSFCLFLLLRLYSKVDHLEKRVTALNERASIILSDKSSRSGNK